MTDCPARRHTPTYRSLRNGCTCPATIARVREQRTAQTARQCARRRDGAYRPVSRVDPLVDEIAVERAMRDQPVRLTTPERRVAAERLTAVGLSAAQIAARLRVTQRTIVRYRAAARTTGGIDVSETQGKNAA